MSAAPEIAQLAIEIPAQSGAHTVGALARELRLLASHPERWWGRAAYHPGRSEKTELELAAAGIAAWMMVLAPGDPGRYCDCDVMMLVAGEAVEESVADGGAVSTTLRAGRARVHGQGQVHQIRANSKGFAITLHVRGSA
jgi:hypothetical protein